MPRNVDYWYELYGPGRMLIDNPDGADAPVRQISEEEKLKKQKKLAKRKEKDVLEDKNCIRRLMKDIKELAMCAGDFPNVSAAPLEDNIYLWHANVTAPDGKLKGLCVHLEIQFPSSYPRNPPKIKCLTPIRHPNVFGRYICLTMLLKRKYNDDPHEGWTGAYTVASILLQLQSFLFSDHVTQDINDYNGRAYVKKNYVQDTSIASLANFQCKRCRHTGIRPFPPIGFKLDHEFQSPEERFSREWEVYQETCPKNEFIHHKQARRAAKREFICRRIEEEKVQTAKKSERELNSTAAFPKKCSHILVEYLDPYEILMVAMLYPTWDTVNEKYNLQEKFESSCFFTKLDYREAALGYGVRVQYDPFKQKEIRQLSSDLDLISWHAWKKLKHRISAWGNECDLYIPLVLNDSHMRNSKQLMWTQLRKLASVSAGDDDHDERILDALCALMNSMVVGMLKIEGEVRMWHSEKALQGYCRFHQLLLHVCNDCPEIRQLAESKVENFIKNPRARHKKGGTPDLGRLLVMLSVSDKYGWDDIRKPFFEEVTVRQAKWNIMACPVLRFDCDTRDYATWFRAMKPLDVLSAPRKGAPTAKNPRGQDVRMPTAGTLVYGRKIEENWIKIDTPCRGFVENKPFTPKLDTVYLDESLQEAAKMKLEKIDTLQELPFKLPALCVTKRAAAGRAKESKTSRFVRNIEAGTYCVVLDIIGNRAQVAFVVPGKQQTSAMKRVQTIARARKTMWGTIIDSIEIDSRGNAKPQQDALWISMTTKKGPLLEPVQIPDDWRLDECFKHTQVSRQLIMFQKAFLDVIKEGKTLEELSEMYLSKWGNPPKGTLPTLHAQVKSIKKSKTWNDYLHYLKLDMLSKADMIELLKRSVGNSERKRYTHPFHTGYDELPDVKKHKPSKKPSLTFVEENLGENYVSRYARKPRVNASRTRRRRKFDAGSESDSSEDLVFNPAIHKCIKPNTAEYPKHLSKMRFADGRPSFFKGDFYSLFVGGLPRDDYAHDLRNQIRVKIPRGSTIRVPRDDDDLSRGFAFVDVPSIQEANYLIKNGIVLDGGRKIQPRFARVKTN